MQLPFIIVLLVCGVQLNAQEELRAQNVTFNSSIQLTQDQRSRAGISDAEANNIEVAVNFERSNWADGSVETNPFYEVPSNASHAKPGSLLKLQLSANTSRFTLPPNTALSRILYQTQTLNGSSIPASAFILWPYAPRVEKDGFPVVGWGHGTSGGFANCAPSHIRNLWYQFTAPYTLALQGYVVVAPDYAGLGVGQDLDGKPIRHPYAANPAHANDLFYSVEAAQSAFASLSKRFVLMGHSQGGGAAWGAAQRQALRPVDGYLGAIAGSPVTNIYDLLPKEGDLDPVDAMLIANALLDIFPAFNPGSILTEAGLKRYGLISSLQGCQSVHLEALNVPSLALPEWYNNNYAREFFNMTSNGGRKIRGPLLVLQGEGDQAVPAAVTSNAVNTTCSLYPDSQLQYIKYPGVTHVPVMYASQPTWLQWIADRFAGMPVSQSCSTSSISSARPHDEYQLNGNWFIEFATDAYEIA